MLKGRMILPNVALVELISPYDNGVKGYVHCSIPGGFPQFSMTDPCSLEAKPFPVVNAPQCDSLSDLINFCNERFIDEDDN